MFSMFVARGLRGEVDARSAAGERHRRELIRLLGIAAAVPL
jgi:hypothetical protein